MDSTTAGSASPALVSLTRALAGFGLRLYRELPPEGNCFFSPLGVATALLTLLPGARGGTARELESVLGVDGVPDDLGSHVSELRAALERRTVIYPEWDAASYESRDVERDTLLLTLATALFVEERFPLQTDYCALLEESFGADFFSLAFADPTAAARRINAWVGEKTGGRIPTIVSPDALTPESRLVLANAIHFKARWAEPFEERVTRPGRFHRLGGVAPKLPSLRRGLELLLGRDGGVVQVPMMWQVSSYAHWSDGDLAALRVPYEAGLSMLILLPAKGRLRDVEGRLDMELLDRIAAGAEHRLVHLRLPRFELRTRFSLSRALRSLGLDEALAPTADFGGISPHRDGLMLSDVLHEAWVSVDERGTEAAAATAVLMVMGSAPHARPPKPIRFHVDRPFFFAIQDDRTKSLLFFGRVTDPSK